MSGQLGAGEHLRVEPLAGELGISVTPIRESLLELLGEGYLEREPNRGYVVAEITRDGFEDEVLVLAMITGELAARAVDNLSNERLAELNSLQRDIQNADKRGDHEEAEALNHRFHTAINKLAGSPKLAWNAQRHSHYVPRTTFESLESSPSVCTHEHRKILAAMRTRDREAARVAMTNHLIDSGKQVADALTANGLWA